VSVQRDIVDDRRNEDYLVLREVEEDSYAKHEVLRIIVVAAFVFSTTCIGPHVSDVHGPRPLLTVMSIPPTVTSQPAKEVSKEQES